MSAHDVPPPAGDAGSADPLEQRTEIDVDAGSRLPFGGGAHRTHAPPAVPDHELLGRIGQGAYGEVWLARNIMGAFRAVKIVYRDSFDSERPYEREFSGIQRFEPISRSHESQVDILHIGRNDDLGCFYYVMELADDAAHGRQIDPRTYAPRTIRSELKQRGRFPVAESIEISLALTTALGHLHQNGLIHRDVKPANVIFVNGLPKLADIGLVTETGGTMSFVGTEGYLPPEGPGSVQADIFSLGKTLYEVATGKDRFDFPELPTLTEASADEAGLFELNEILLKACHPDVQQRYRSADEMRADLVLVQAGKSVRRSRALERRLTALSRVAMGLVVVAVLAGLAFVYEQYQTREARRLAAVVQELAQRETHQRQRAESLLQTMELKEAEQFFANEEAAQGVAYLARLLRQNPSNEVAAARLLSALTHGSFALPVRLFEAEADIEDAAFSPDGRRILAWTSADATNHFAWLWDTQTGVRIGSPMRHEKAIGKAGFSPDGRWIATVSRDGTARVWKGETGEPVGEPLRYTPPASWGTYSEPIVASGFAFSPDSQSLATVFDGFLRVWRIASGELLWPSIELRTQGGVNTIEFSPDGLTLAVADASHTLYFFDVRSGAQMPKYGGHGNFLQRGLIGSLYSPDGSFVVGKRDNDNLVLLDARTLTEVHRLRHRASISAWRFSPDGLFIAVGDVAQQVRLWETATGESLLDPLQHKEILASTEFNTTGDLLLTVEMKRCRIWDASTGEPLSQWLWGSGQARGRFSPDGRFALMVSTGTREAVLYDCRPGMSLGASTWRSSLPTAVKFDREGKRAMASYGGVSGLGAGRTGFGSGAIWIDLRTGQVGEPLASDGNGIQHVEWSPDGARFAAASLEGYARVWQAPSRVPVTPLLRHDGEVTSARFSADGTRLVTASKGREKSVRIWDIGSGQLEVGPMVHSNDVTFAELSPDGRWVLTSPGPGTERLWDAGSGALRGVDLGIGPAGGNWIQLARFSPDGRRMAVGYGNRKVVLWDTATARPLKEVTEHRYVVTALSFSADGKLLVTGSTDGSVRVFDVRTGEMVADPMLHDQPVFEAVLSRDGRRVLVAAGNSARVWDVRSARPITEPLRHREEIFCVEFSHDGRFVATGSFDGEVRISELPQVLLPVPAWLLDLAEAAAGQRYAAANSLEPVSPLILLEMRRRVIEQEGADFYTEWARWFLADRLSRGTSVSSLTSVSNRIAGLTEADPLEFLHNAVQLAPRDPSILVRLSLRLSAVSSNDIQFASSVRRASFLSDQALALDGGSALSWRAKAEAMHAAGRDKEALPALDRALALSPAAVALWERKGQWLARAGQTEAAILAYTKAIESLEAAQLEQKSDAFAVRQKQLRVRRSDLFRQIGRWEEAIADRMRGLAIPARGPHLPVGLIDLSAHYHRSLLDHNSIIGVNTHHVTDHLSSLAGRSDPLAGVRFDLRGSIRRQSTRFDDSRTIHLSADRVQGIPVQQKCRRLHFLHSLVWGPAREPAVRLVVHYADGHRQELSVIAGENVGWWVDLNAGKVSDANVAWREPAGRANVYGAPADLYLWSWDNPRAEVLITTIDIEPPDAEKESVDSGYVLVAITAQNEPTPVVTRQPESVLMRAGGRVEFSVQAQSACPLRYQWRLNGVPIPGANQPVYAIANVTSGHAGSYTAEVRNALDDSVITVTSAAASLAVEADGLVHGRLRVEAFRDIPGSRLSALTNHTRFPNKPDHQSWVTHFESASNVGDNYGVRLSGYLVPPRSGDYRFFISADDESALFLSSDERPEAKRLIAREPSWNRDRLWQATHGRPRRENVSVPIRLEAGARYYVEALMKEGDGSDNLAVTWQMPGDPEPENHAPPIVGEFLAVPTAWLESGDQSR